MPNSGKRAQQGTKTWVAIVRLVLVAVAVLVALWLVKGGLGSGADSGDGPSAGGESEGLTGATAIEIEGDADAPVVGQPAPGFSATDLKGEEISLADMRGKPVWLVFNATWCANCRAEIPDVEQAYEQRGDQVDVVSVYVSDSVAAVKSYGETLGLSYPQVVDEDNQIAAAYGVMGLPTHVFITSEGDVAAIHVGALSPAKINEQLDLLVK